MVFRLAFNRLSTNTIDFRIPGILGAWLMALFLSFAFLFAFALHGVISD
jgi:hypothetical protein